MWDKNHPLYKLAVKPDDEPVEVANEYATTRLHLPNIDDGWLSDCLAKTAAIDRFQDAANLAPTVALESYAIFYLSIGGTPEALKRYNDALGIKRASQAQNDWQPLIRWIAGQAWDQSNRKPARISKFAALMQYWMLYLADDPKYTRTTPTKRSAPAHRALPGGCWSATAMAALPTTPRDHRSALCRSPTPHPVRSSMAIRVTGG